MAAHVIDTNVLVAALRSPIGASREVLLAGLNQRFEMLISVPLLLEYESVLKRTEQLEVMTLSRRDIDTVLSDLFSVARKVNLAYRWRPKIRDPKDDMVFETAINGGANSIITFNTRHFAEASKEFGIRVQRPVEILRALRSGGS
jgi:putative PIN family toxin of toxin-antitoxin system